MTTSIEHFTHQTEIERQKREKAITSKKAVLGRLLVVLETRRKPKQIEFGGTQDTYSYCVNDSGKSDRIRFAWVRLVSVRLDGELNG